MTSQNLCHLLCSTQLVERNIYFRPQNFFYDSRRSIDGSMGGEKKMHNFQRLATDISKRWICLSLSRTREIQDGWCLLMKFQMFLLTPGHLPDEIFGVSLYLSDLCKRAIFQKNINENVFGPFSKDVITTIMCGIVPLIAIVNPPVVALPPGNVWCQKVMCALVAGPSAPSPLEVLKTFLSQPEDPSGKKFMAMLYESCAQPPPWWPSQNLYPLLTRETTVPNI